MAINTQLPKPFPGFNGINRYWDKHLNMPAAKILPGEYYVTRHDEVIVTVLGSCISACIRDAKRNIGGMNHFMLPKQVNPNVSQLMDESTRYGNYAMEHMINDILKNGGKRENLEVKIFGGGKILATMTDIGMRNISFVHEYILAEGLKLLAEDTGDRFPRKVMYFPFDGKARVKRLKALHNNTVIEREITYMHNIEAKPVEGEIELF
jgi:chemotaxis protein CheD